MTRLKSPPSRSQHSPQPMAPHVSRTSEPTGPTAPDDRPAIRRTGGRAYLKVRGALGRNYWRLRGFLGRNYWRLRGFLGRNYWRLRGFLGRNYWRLRSLPARTRSAAARTHYTLVRAPFYKARHKIQCWKGAVQRFFWRRTCLLACARTVQFLLLPVYAAVLLYCCRDARRKRQARIDRGDKPRLVWGPYPNFSTVEIARGLRPAGYVCDSIVYYNFGRIWKSDVFKYCLTDELEKFSYVLGQVLKLT